MQEIKKCQFCGSDDQKIVSFSSGANSHVAEHYVICDTCGAQGPIAVNSELAILKWNDRILEAPELPEEKVNIIEKYEHGFYYCPFLSKVEKIDEIYDIVGVCEMDKCMMWVSVGEDKGRCGLVNTMYINSTGCSAV